MAKHFDTTGGSGRHLTNIVTALRNSGHEVEILMYDKGFWDLVKKIRRAAKVCDIVQVIDMRDIAFAGFLATRFTHAKFIVVTQGTYAVAPLYSRKRALFARYIYKAASAVVAISTYTAREIQKKIPGLKISIIDPGIDLSNFSVLERHFSEEFLENPLIVGVGTVKARKGYHIALQAFAKLKSKIPGARYVIVGPQTDEPNYVNALKKLAVELGVAQDVEFRPNISDAELKSLYGKASLFVLTSINEGFHFEGYGMVFLEAAANGLPSVGTFGNGIEDAVEPGRTGLLVPQNDVDATAEAIKDILSDRERYIRMSKESVRFAHEHDLAHLGQKYSQLYASLG